MAVYLAEHTHPAERCPAKNPPMAQGLLGIVSPDNARRNGITIHGEAVANGKHHLYLIVEGPSEEAVLAYFAPFRGAGSLTVSAASSCEEVVHRGAC